MSSQLLMKMKSKSLSFQYTSLDNEELIKEIDSSKEIVSNKLLSGI